MIGRGVRATAPFIGPFCMSVGVEYWYTDPLTSNDRFHAFFVRYFEDPIHVSVTKSIRRWETVIEHSINLSQAKLKGRGEF